MKRLMEILVRTTVANSHASSAPPARPGRRREDQEQPQAERDGRERTSADGGAPRRVFRLSENEPTRGSMAASMIRAAEMAARGVQGGQAQDLIVVEEQEGAEGEALEGVRQGADGLKELG